MNKIDELKKIFNERLLFNEPMSRHTSFKTGGNADIFVYANAKNELNAIRRYAREKFLPLFLTGNGTNLLVTDKGFRGVIVNLCNIKKITVNGEFVTALCGNSMSETAAAALKAGLSGCEFMSGIPGSVGGGVYMNAGAYGGEIKDIVCEVVSLDEEGNEKKYDNSALKMSYRNSIFCENGEIVYSACFRLKEADPDMIADKMHELNGKRKEKQPLEYPSAGSTFKRPEGYFAAALIEEAGLKGKKHGGAMVSDKHSGFIINYDNATSSDIIELIEYVKETVFEKYGVMLVPEVKIIGEK